MQKNTMLLSLIAACVAVIAATNTAEAAKTKVTTMVVAGEICGGCVKKITAKLKPMSGVAKVKCDIKTKTVSVTPRRGKTLSPRKLWEAMESIGKTPAKLTGPSGTFTKKPKA